MEDYCFFCGEKTSQVKGFFFVCTKCWSRSDYGRCRKKGIKGNNYKGFFTK